MAQITQFGIVHVPWEKNRTQTLALICRPVRSAEDSIPITNDDDLQDVSNDATLAEVKPENAATAQENDDEAGQNADPLIAITAERDALKDQLLRALADMENMRRRSEREADTARKYGHTQFARDLVGAIDNLARALASAPGRQIRHLMSRCNHY